MSLTLPDQLDALRHGDHVCMLYATADEQMAATVPFIHEGLRRSELCVFIAEAGRTDRFKAGLAGRGVDVAAALDRGQLVLLDDRATYLPTGSFRPDDMLGELQATIDLARQKGFTGVRPTGDMSWALGGAADSDRLIEYEAKLNRLISVAPLVGICQYDRSRFPPPIVRDLLRTHPIAVLGDKVCPNAFYEPPELVLGEDGEARRSAWMIAQLEHARSAELRLIQMNAELESFAFAAAHDLQEPLRLIRVYLDLLMRETAAALTPTATRHVEVVQRSAERMSKLVGGILDYGRLDAGSGVVDIDLGALLADVVDELRPSITDTAASVVIGPLPRVRGERELIQLLFRNLLGNALKFRRGPPRIRVTAVERPDAHVFAIADNGIGIPRELVPLLFRIFKRLHGADAYPGHGIGLAACRKIVERHHGRIWAESVEGEGSTFYVSLPR